MKSEWTRDNDNNLIITTWDVSKVTNMVSMFTSCSAFNQESIRTWNMKPLFDDSPNNANYMFRGTALVNNGIVDATPSIYFWQLYAGNESKGYQENP